MESRNQKKERNKNKRAIRVRKRLRGTTERPRLCVVRSNEHIYAQVIDDASHMTLVSASTIAKDFAGAKKNKESGKQIGLKIAELALQKNIKKVIFDRGAHKYHGIVATVADGAREGGLEL